MSGRLVIHAGAAKCGSSALQAALCRDAEALARRGVAYVALREPDVVLSMGTLSREARRSAFGYVRTMPPSKFATLSEQQQQKIRQTLAKFASRYETVVLSNEGLFQNPSPDLEKICAGLGLRTELVAYLRPQVSWMNSAWWQWGAWGDLGLEGFVEKRLPSTKWAELASRHRSCPWIDDVHLRVLPQDIVADFYAFLGCKSEQFPKLVRSNVSLPSEVLRVYQRNRHLRPKPHVAKLDFVLERRLKVPGQVPWVLGADMIKRVIDRTSADNQELVNMLSPDQADSIEADSRWWDASAFDDRTVETASTTQADTEQLEALCVRMMEELGSMDETLRRLEAASTEGTAKLLASRLRNYLQRNLRSFKA